MSPRIRNIPGPYRFYFVSFDCSEPPHIHADRENFAAKFWLEPVELCRNYGYSTQELGKILDLIHQHRRRIMEAWNEHCNPE